MLSNKQTNKNAKVHHTRGLIRLWPDAYSALGNHWAGKTMSQDHEDYKINQIIGYGGRFVHI